MALSRVSRSVMSPICLPCRSEADDQPGTRVTILIKDVPRSVVGDRNPKLPFIVHGLLQHEHKQSVLHFVVQRNTEYTEPVKAKVSPHLFITVNETDKTGSTCTLCRS